MNELAKLIFLECWYHVYLSQRCPYKSRLSRKRFFIEHVTRRRNV